MSEDAMSAYFLPATMLPIPEGVQDEVPRIVAQTKNGHSLLSIALTVATFATTYDDFFSDDWAKCREYLQKRCDCFYTTVNNITDGNHSYVGLVTELELFDDDETGIALIKENLLASGGSKLGDLFDAGCKLTYVMDDTYYVNIRVENIREFETKKAKQEDRLLIEKSNMESV